MFTKIDLGYSFRLLHPRPAVIIVSTDGRVVNGCTVSWITPVNVDPPIIAFSLSPRRYTYELIKKSGEATVNIMGYKHARETHFVGSVSGRDVGDKLTKAGFHLRRSEYVKPPYIEEALAYMECRVVREVEFTDHNMVFCRVLNAFVKKDLFRNNLFTEEAKILMHVGRNVYTSTSTHSVIEE